MSKTGLQYVEYVLENNWESSITGRVNAVPQPEVTVAADVDLTRVDTRRQDHIFVTSGGPVSHEPRSVGWTEERDEKLVTIDIRTTESRVRLEGGRDENNEAERFGGLAGEVERILDSKRKGDKEFDWIDAFEYRDQSEEVGYGNWRGTYELRLTTIAEYINTDP